MLRKSQAPDWLREFLSLEGGARGRYLVCAYLAVLLFADGMGVLAGRAFGGAAALPVEAIFSLLMAPTYARRMHYNLRSRVWAWLPIIALNPGARAITDWGASHPGPIQILVLLSFATAALAGLYMLFVSRRPARTTELRPRTGTF